MPFICSCICFIRSCMSPIIVCIRAIRSSSGPDPGPLMGPCATAGTNDTASTPSSASADVSRFMWSSFLFPSDREHGAARGRHDPAGDAPDEELRETRAPVRPDHHELGVLGLGRANNLVVREPFQQQAPRAHAGGLRLSELPVELPVRPGAGRGGELV